MRNKLKADYALCGALGIISTIKAKLGSSNNLLKVERKAIKAPFFLRPKTSDIATFAQIFINKDYDFDTNKQPKVIIDAGVNIFNPR
jgi:hypothetical protein